LSYLILNPPGDKSISHRLLFLSALADKKTELENLSQSDDVKSTINFLSQIGKNDTPINCNNSGTTMRLGAGLIASLPIETTLFGDESLTKRPMDRIIEPLERMGAKLSWPPLKIQGGNLHGIEYELPLPSAQVKSAILFAGLNAEGETKIIEPVKSRDHTERWFKCFGIDVRQSGNSISSISLIGKQNVISPGHCFVPGDPSSSAFLVVATLLGGKRELLLKNVCLNQTRVGWLKILVQMGANIEIANMEEGVEPVGDLLVSPLNGKRLTNVHIDNKVVPSLIDELPLLALVATQSLGKMTVSGAAELRKKESDRIESICCGLHHLGATIAPTADGFLIEGPTKLSGGSVDSFGDHRIAMTLSLANISSSEKVEVIGEKSVTISYPQFFEDLHQVIS